MDTDSTRRSFDRSREPGTKKPRLTDELDRGSNPTARPFPQQRQPAPPSARFRTNGDRDSESSDSGRVGYYPQPLPPHQELVAQYKTALGELTFNSKPIITNLTIIAGENTSAAKAIAYTICTNILEVPNEQKLPSLYLLDSIVKNIGRDYIKYFAAKLPEVFCKTYRQVEPSLHSSMRHLFGTWKTVFPPQTLQMIDKELGFTPAVNGSASASAMLRSDSQSQRPPHSIHVNPKYLERQRLQQSSRTKEVVSDLTGAISNSNEDPERPNKVLGASRPWLDPRLSMQNNQHIQRDAFNDSFPEKSVAQSFGGNENGSDISSKLGLSMGRTGSRVTELGHDKTWYKTGIDVSETTISGQRNGLSFKHGFSNREAPKSVNLDAHHQPTQNMTSIRSSEVSNSWKNSEEEEFMWDEMNSGMSGDGAASLPNTFNDPWTGGDDENLKGEGHLQVTHPFGVKVDREISSIRKQPAALGGHSSFSLQLQKQRSIEKLNMKPGHSEGFMSNLGLSANTNSLASRVGNQSFMPNATTGLAEIIGQQQFDSVRVESTSGQSPLRQLTSSLPLTVRHPHPIQNLADEDHPPAPKAPQIFGGLQSQYVRDRPPALPPNAQVGNLHRSREKDLQGPLVSVTSFQPRHQQQQLGSSQSVNTKKPPHFKVSLSSETSELSTTSSLSTAAVKSGILPKKSSPSSLAMRNVPSESGDRPTWSGGPSPASLISSGPVAASSSLSVPSNDDSSVPLNVPQVKVGQRSRVSATQLLASANVSSVSAPTSNATKNNSLNPISNLLSSLVAKGLISAETESPTKLPPEALVGLEKQTESIAVCSTLPVVSVSSSAAIPVPSSRDEADEADEAKTSLTLCQSNSTEVRNIIGFDFKPDVIRELHPTVIKELLDDLPHLCGICGIKLKQEEQLNRHLEWHSTREREQNGLAGGSRKWYANLDDWIAGKAQYPSDLSDSADVYGEKTDMNQLDTVVLADENQCLCILCGELFEDVYCEEREEWMFEGAVYLNNSDDNGEMESINVGPIVHAKCLSDNSLSNVTKMEQD